MVIPPGSPTNSSVSTAAAQQSRASLNNQENITPPRRSSRKHKLKNDSFKGMTTDVIKTPYAVGRYGGAYHGKGAMKRANGKRAKKSEAERLP
jgi:hypothetical protein